MIAFATLMVLVTNTKNKK
ncbi:hypothetical protein [Lactococcus kimchii]